MENCPLCGGLSEMRCDRYPGYRLPATFAILHCNSCDTAFARPGTADMSLYEAIYEHSHRVPGYSRYVRYGEDVLRMSDPLGYLAGCEPAYWACKRYLDTIGNHKRVRILEIGSGLGYLTYALARAGYEVTGLDVSRVAVRRAAARYGDLYLCGDIRNLLMRQRRGFDLVILTEVIEHVEDIKELILNCLECARDQGTVFATTPNKSAFPAHDLWRTECPPVHLWWLSEQSMRAVAKSCNSGIAFLDFTDYNRNRVPARPHDWVPRPVFNRDGTLIRADLTDRVIRSAQTLAHRARVLNTVRRARAALRAGLAGRRADRNGWPHRQTTTLCSLITRDAAALAPALSTGRAYT